MFSYTFFGLPPTPHSLNTQFFTSWLLPAWALATLRLLLSIYAFTTIFYSFGWFAHHIDIFHLKDINLQEITFSLGASAIAKSFSYFTYLSYWGLAFYFFTSSVHTFRYWRTNTTWLASWPRWLRLAHTVFYSSVIAFPPMVSAIYWGSMFVDRWYILEFDQWSNTSIHILNTVFAVCEIVLPRTKSPPWPHLLILMLFMSLYLGLVYISKAVEDFYPYLWLDPKVGWRQIIAHIIGYTMSIVLVFNVVVSLVWLRRNMTESRDDDDDGDEEEMSDDEIALHPAALSDPEMATPATSSSSRSAFWDFDRSRPHTAVSMPDAVYGAVCTPTQNLTSASVVMVVMVGATGITMSLSPVAAYSPRLGSLSPEPAPAMRRVYRNEQGFWVLTEREPRC